MAALTTADRVKAYANVKTSVDDASIEGIIDAVSALLHDRIGHDFEGTAIVAEHHSHPYSGALILARPVESIQAVRENGTTLAASGYELQGERLLYRLGSGKTIGWAPGVRSIEVDYTPTSTVPADIELAAREVSAFMLKQSALAVGGGRMGLSGQANADAGSADYFIQALDQLPMASMVLAKYQRFA